MLKPTTVQWLRSELKNTSLCRAELARELCRRDEWRNPLGELCAASARKGLPQLARDLGLPLPAPSRRTGGCARGSPQGVRQAFPAVQVQCSLQELGEVRLCRADTPEQRRHWSALLAAEHPLGRGLAPGCRLVYGIRARGLELGVLSWVAAPLRLAPRDQLLGWDERTRRHNIARLVSNDRFLIREGVQVRNLASHVLAQALRRLPEDWKARHGAVPVAVETCVGQPHKGTCYQAAGFELVGETAGYAWGVKRPRQRKQPQEARPAPQSGPGQEEVRADPKQVWMQGLTQEEGEWKAALRARPQRVLGRFPPLELDEDAPWSRREFERSDLPDRRLRERLLTMGEAWEHKPGQCLPDLFPSGALQQGAYRFLHNGRVSMEDVLQPHREALAERCRQLPGSVLLVQDTTTLNYTGLKDCTAGLGPLKERSSSSRGLHVHAAMAFSEGRRPLGVSGLEVWSRALEKPPGEDEKESRRWFRGLEQGYELASACPDRRIVVVGDRESDIFDLFRQHGERSEEGVELLVRVHLGRQRLVRVWDPGCRSLMIRPLRDQPDFMTQVRFERSFEVDSQGGRRARKRRTVETEVCIGAVEVQAPKERRQRGEEGIGAWLVHVRQTNAEPGEKPLEWWLTSTVGGPSESWARRIVGWYEARWGIEEFFRVLKSGMRIEDRRLRTADALKKCLVFDAVTAWQVFSLARHARDAPDTPVEEVLTPDEREVIGTLVRKQQLLPPQERGRDPPPDIRTWVVWLARTAGFRPSRRRPLPGNEILWRAYSHVALIAHFQQLARS